MYTVKERVEAYRALNMNKKAEALEALYKEEFEKLAEQEVEASDAKKQTKKTQSKD